MGFGKDSRAMTNAMKTERKGVGGEKEAKEGTIGEI